MPGCALLTLDGWCDTHRENSTARQYDQYRGSSSSRGYGSAWQIFRQSYLAQHPLCVDCQAQSVVAVATELHHPIKVAAHPERQFDETNIMALCKPHHSARTARGE